MIENLVKSHQAVQNSVCLNKEMCADLRLHLSRIELLCVNCYTSTLS